MDRRYQGQPIFIKGFVAPLTINKLFAGYDYHREGTAYAEYTAFVDHVLETVGDIGTDEPILGFDVRDGEPTKIQLSRVDTSSQSDTTPKDVYAPGFDIERIKFENDSLRRSNENLRLAKVKQTQDNQAFLWAMLALAGIIVLGLFGFGD
jgi:hypothetical protein